MHCSVERLTDTDWDNLVLSSPQGTVFSSIKWMNIFDKPYTTYGVVVSGNLIGGIGGFDTYTPLTPFQGVLMAPYDGKYVSLMSHHNGVAEELVDVLPKEFYCHYAYPDIRPFLWMGRTAKVKYTYVVSLNEKTWDEMDKDVRNLIRHVDEKMMPIDADMFNSMYSATFVRQGLKQPVSEELVKKVIGLGKVYGIDGAGAVILKDNKRAYYILGASTKENASPSLLWQIFEKLINEGVKEIDLVGCNSRNIGNFKKGFGGVLTPYYGLV